jgi:hypothetical protein
MPFTDRFKHRPLSYSQYSSWMYDKDQWYQRYVLNTPDPATPAMLYGNVVGDSIGTAGSLVPSLQPPGVKEYELRAQLGDIFIVGYCDHYDPATKTLHENKTSDNLKRWDQQKVDEHKQLDMYALMLYLRDKTIPEEVTMYLNFIPVVRGGDMIYTLPQPPVYQQFATRRTTKQVLMFATELVHVVKEMEAYVN